MEKIAKLITSSPLEPWNLLVLSLFFNRQLISHSVHWGINTPLKKTTPSFLPSPPLLYRQTVQAPPPFLGNLPSILVFREPLSLKVRFLSEPPQKLKFFHP